MMRVLRVAIAKGRLERKLTELFSARGVDCTALQNPGRRLILPFGKWEAVLAKAPDVLTYVEHGTCDFGIVGKDTILEHGGSFYELLDLGLGKCRFSLAAAKGSDFFGNYGHKRIASKYPNVAYRYFLRRGMDVEIIKLEGSVELAPLLGLADAIVDIVETGATLLENGLEIIEDIHPISARLIANIGAMKTRRPEMAEFVRMCEESVKC